MGPATYPERSDVMRGQRLTHIAGLWLAASALASMAAPVAATDLIDQLKEALNGHA